MPTYILDFVVECAKFVSVPNFPIQYAWMKFKADGINQTISTAQIRPSNCMEFNKSVRFILNLDRLNGYHLAASFNIIPYNQTESQVYALAQVRLNELPFGNPRRLSFPLMSNLDTSVVAIQVTIFATISELQPIPQPQVIQIPAAQFQPVYQEPFAYPQYIPAFQQQIPWPGNYQPLQPQHFPQLQHQQNQTNPVNTYQNHAPAQRAITRRFGKYPKK
ncbi:hypothetical protein GPJ56_004625 [Histomonas meleagridis]|uniref:uncharacterized protein n=1 Tax=Histomonas meleagridis TaxID=135588 RepID=UPI003559B492|nr:hypothetical protein GPJ56_004625 [Histomonas meleagridis]KAH0797386.1 hypothetical protein GO595_009707 [Histomonas meleagridis]